MLCDLTPFYYVSVLIENPHPLLSELFIRGVLNGVINRLLHELYALFVFLEHMHQFLYHIEPVSVLYQTFHHFKVA